LVKKKTERWFLKKRKFRGGSSKTVGKGKRGERFKGGYMGKNEGRKTSWEKQKTNIEYQKRGSKTMEKKGKGGDEPPTVLLGGEGRILQM